MEIKYNDGDAVLKEIERRESKNEDIIKGIIAQERGLLPTTCTTFTTFTTSINNWGYINIDETILLELIERKVYIYNIKGHIGIAYFKYECPSCGALITSEELKTKCGCGKVLSSRKHEKIKIRVDNREYIFKLEENRKHAKPIYCVPSLNEIKDMLVSINRSDDTKELFNDIVNFLSALFDFHNPNDPKVCAIYILFSYILPYFNSSFYLGMDATKGSGKTTLLEIITFLMRHGFFADISAAAIPRLKQKFDLNLAIDEIDQLSSKEDLEGMLRKGQRRGNKYVRLNKNTLEEEIYEAFGVYAYSFRSSVEDAFKQRSILIRTARAKDNRLPVINMCKEQILKPLLNKIFFWYIKNFFIFGSKSSMVVQVVHTFTHEQKNLRDLVYQEMTKGFSQEELNIVESLLGRNSEIGYIFLQVSKFLKIDISKEIAETMHSKQDEEEVSEEYYYDLMKDIFLETIEKSETWVLGKGEYAGKKYYPKTQFFYHLVQRLKDNGLMSIGTNKFNSLLKDIGFIKNFNIVNQKIKVSARQNNSYPVPCLVFTDEVLVKLGVIPEKLRYT